MIETIKRNQIKKAPYNPRVISEEHLANLEKSMKKFGMVGVFVWNKRTGHLIAGHQRLSIEDKNHAGGEEYEVQVDATDLSLEEEQELNMLLNSGELTGEFKRDEVKRIVEGLAGKTALNLEALVLGIREKAAVKLKKLDVMKPPRMNWLLIGIPLLRYGEVEAYVAAILKVPDIRTASVVSDGQEDGQLQSGS